VGNLTPTGATKLCANKPSATHKPLGIATPVEFLNMLLQHTTGKTSTTSLLIGVAVIVHSATVSDGEFALTVCCGVLPQHSLTTLLRLTLTDYTPESSLITTLQHSVIIIAHLGFLITIIIFKSSGSHLEQLALCGTTISLSK
jgi:hypothetical protein